MADGRSSYQPDRYGNREPQARSMLDRWGFAVTFAATFGAVADGDACPQAEQERRERHEAHEDAAHGAGT